MEKPELRKVIEKLKEADVREWEIIKNPHTHYGPYFELNRYGLIFRVDTSRRDGTSYMLSIEDHDKNVHIVYKEIEEVFKFYKELSKGIENYQEKDATEKLGFLLSENGLEGSDLEHIIARLKELDTQAWKPDHPFGTTKYPTLVTQVSGVTFCIGKKLIRGYALEVKYEKESTKKIKYTNLDKKHARKLIGEIYEKVYKELKEDKEKELEKDLTTF